MTVGAWLLVVFAVFVVIGGAVWLDAWWRTRDEEKRRFPNDPPPRG